MFPARALSVAVAACLPAASCVPTVPGGPAPSLTGGRVVKVHDGDTITVESCGGRHRCRLLGIDAPEMSCGRLRSEMRKVTKYAPPEARDELEAARRTFEKWAAAAEARAREARDALAAMVDGETVRLAYDSKQPRTDRYGRLLIYVSADETDAGAEMIRRGLAVAETRFACDRLQEYAELWRKARAARVGLWARPGGSPRSGEKPAKAHGGEAEEAPDTD